MPQITIPQDVNEAPAPLRLPNGRYQGDFSGGSLFFHEDSPWVAYKPELTNLTTHDGEAEIANGSGSIDVSGLTRTGTITLQSNDAEDLDEREIAKVGRFLAAVGAAGPGDPFDWDSPEDFAEKVEPFAGARVGFTIRNKKGYDNVVAIYPLTTD